MTRGLQYTLYIKQTMTRGLQYPLYIKQTMTRGTVKPFKGFTVPTIY